MEKHNISRIPLVALKHFYGKFFGVRKVSIDKCNDIEEAARIMSDALLAERPAMVSRFGAVELSCVTNFLGISNPKHSVWGYIKGLEPEWWWNPGVRRTMTDNAGFFPSTDENLARFSELMLEDMKLIDVLGSWQKEEYRYVDRFPNAKRVRFLLLDPFWSKVPWTYYLKGKKVLVVHPFKDEILGQYEKREMLFSNPKILPEFELQVLRSVQSIGGNTYFKDWFEALEYMKSQIEELDFDVCLLGCGAYGLPLAAHVKRMGKKAIHVGGSLQLYFGIRGKRWENPHYAETLFGKLGMYSTLINKHWIRPGEAAQVKNAERVDGACYW